MPKADAAHASAVPRAGLARRRFLLLAGGSLLLATLPEAGSCAGARRSDLRALPDLPDVGVDRDVLEAVALASLAPSGHNAQPWRLEVIGRRSLGLALDPGRRLPAVDPDDREALISLGCFLESAVEGASALGIELATEIERPAGTASGEPARVARLSFGPLSAPPAPGRADALRRRRTLRKGHRRRALVESELAPMSAGIERAHFAHRDSPRGQRLAALTLRANVLQAGRRPAVEELSRWIRWRDDEARRRRDGLTPESMEIGGVSGWIVRSFYTPADVLGDDFRERTIELARAQTEHAGGWLVLGSPPDPGVSELLEAGRRAQRAWLRAAPLGIAVHPMSQALEERETQAEVQRIFGPDGDRAPGTVQMIFRVGRVGETPPPVSLRRPPALLFG
jgi:nitroreductase